MATAIIIVSLLIITILYHWLLLGYVPATIPPVTATTSDILKLRLLASLPYFSNQKFRMSYRYRLGKHYLDHHQYKKSAVEFEKIYNSGKFGYYHLLAGLGLICIQTVTEKYAVRDETRQHLLTRINHLPDGFLRLHCYGLYFEAMDDLQAAYTNLEHAMRLMVSEKPSEGDPLHLDIVRLTVKMYRPDLTIPWAVQGLNTTTNQENSHYFQNHLIKAHIQLGELEKAEELCRQSYDTAAQNCDNIRLTEAMTNIARICYYRGEIDLAVEQFNKILEIGDNAVKPFAAVDLAGILLAQGNALEATMLLTPLCSQLPEGSGNEHNITLYKSALICLASACIDTGKLDHAQEYLNNFINLGQSDIYLDICCSALNTLIDASSEKITEAIRSINTLSEVIYQSGMHPVMLIFPISILVRTALVVSEFEFALENAVWLINTNKIPANTPMCYYLYGEALRLSGNVPSAIEAYQLSMKCNIISRYTQLSKKRLAWT